MNCPIDANNEIWDPTGVYFDRDTGYPITGRWRPLTTRDLQPASQFGFALAYFGSGVTHVPAGVKAWSIGVISGVVRVNGTDPLPIGTSLNGGNYGAGATLGSAITISGASGASGAYGLVMWEV